MNMSNSMVIVKIGLRHALHEIDQIISEIEDFNYTDADVICKQLSKLVEDVKSTTKMCKRFDELSAELKTDEC